MRVMYLDAWFSMVIFTVATVSFYVLGATVLHRQGLHPEKSKMIETLSEMYVPTFGAWTEDRISDRRVGRAVQNAVCRLGLEQPADG